ncbi:hypothetical protein GCM10009809_18590 [Isoptericola hypogeus]|uniref:LPXTG-motif cell wall anchor domain-containing protein n=1 Tax=Isoptericola hypogeus TaxID=300179 RepID=A0ABN2JD73_9MICO
MKRTLAGVAVSTLALGGMLVATAAPASAHTPEASATCDTLTVNLQAYADDRDGRTNTVTVTVDGATVIQTNFGGSYYNDEIDLVGSSSWSVSVDAWDGHDGTQYDWSDDGTLESCPAYQTGVYVYEKEEKDEPASWDNSLQQTFVTSRDGARFWTKGELPVEDLPEFVCGPGWAVQQDIVKLDEVWAGWPGTIEPPVGKLGRWLVQDGSVHQELSDLVEVPDCGTDSPEPVTLPEPTPVDVCGTDEDAVTLPTSELVTYAEQWNDDRSSVVVTATSKDGVELPEGTTTTWTFDFDTAACEVELPVTTPEVPQVTDLCGVENDEVGLPADSETVTYASTADGIVATAAEGYTLGELPEGYTSTGTTTATYAVSSEAFTDVDCALVPGDIAAVCESEVPYLGYEVGLPEGLVVDDETPLTVTFVNPDGEDYVVTDQPLAGSLLWPGASDTEPLQWPGWEQQADGSYVETDGNYAWTRDGVQVRFEVNPDYVTVVDYPAASTQCANPPGMGGGDVVAGATPEGPQLAATGATVAGVAGIAVLLVGGGATLFWLRRRLQER